MTASAIGKAAKAGSKKKGSAVKPKTPFSAAKAKADLKGTKAIWSKLDDHQLVAQHLSLTLALKAAQTPAPAEPAAKPAAEDPHRIHARSMCGWFLTNEDAGFRLVDPADYTTAINWATIADKEARLAAVNRNGPFKPTRKGYKKFDLEWSDCSLTTMTKAKTRGQLAAVFADCYK